MFLLLLHLLQTKSNALRARFEESLTLQSIDGHTKVSTLVGSGFQSSANGAGALAGLNTPISLAMDNTESTIYATDYSGQGVISKVMISTAYKSNFGSGKCLHSI